MRWTCLALCRASSKCHSSRPSKKRSQNRLPDIFELGWQPAKQEIKGTRPLGLPGSARRKHVLNCLYQAKKGGDQGDHHHFAFPFMMSPKFGTAIFLPLTYIPFAGEIEWVERCLGIRTWMATCPRREKRGRMETSHRLRSAKRGSTWASSWGSLTPTTKWPMWTNITSTWNLMTWDMFGIVSRVTGLNAHVCVWATLWSIRLKTEPWKIKARHRQTDRQTDRQIHTRTHTRTLHTDTQSWFSVWVVWFPMTKNSIDCLFLHH